MRPIREVETEFRTPSFKREALQPHKTERNAHEAEKSLLSDQIASVSQESHRDVLGPSSSQAGFLTNHRNGLIGALMSWCARSDAGQTMELEKILEEGRELHESSDKYAAEARDSANIRPSRPIQLKGKLGLLMGAGILAGTGSYYLSRGATRTGQDPRDDVHTGSRLPAPQPYRMDTTTSSGDNLSRRVTASFPIITTHDALKESAPAMSKIVDNGSINVNQLAYDDITNDTLTPNIVNGIVKFTMNEDYYSRYFKFIFEISISKINDRTSEGNIETDTFINELKENIYLLLSAVNLNKIIRSSGLCDLQAKCIAVLNFIYAMATPTETDRQLALFYYQTPSGNNAEERIGVGARAVLGHEKVNELANELRSALIFLSKNDRPPSFSAEAEIMLRHAGRLFGETRALDQDDFFQNLVIQNTAVNVAELHRALSHELFNEGFLDRYSALAITNLLTSVDESDRKGQLHITMAITYALILSDFGDLCRIGSATFTHPTVLNDILVELSDYKNRHPQPAVNFTSPIPQDDKSVSPHRINISRRGKNDTPISVPLTTSESTTGAGGSPGNLQPADGGAGAVGALGIGAVAAGAVAGADAIATADAIRAVETLRALSVPRAVKIPGPIVAAAPPAQPVFIYPSIKNAIERRESLIAKDGAEERKAYVHNEIKKVYRGMDYVTSSGLEISADDLANIVEAKIMAKSHISYTQEILSKVILLLDEAKISDLKGRYVQSYLRRYFSNVFDTQDDDLLNRVIARFSETTTRTQAFLNELSKEGFKNLWFASSKGDPTRKNDRNEFYSGLSNEHLREMPFATTYASDDKIVVIFAEKSHMTNIEHPDVYRRYQTHHLGETFLHEYTHFSACTQDYMYFSRTPYGRAKNAMSMMLEFHANLKSGEVSENLSFTLDNYCKIYNKKHDNDLLSFFNNEKLFKSYIIMNNAASYEIFFRDIADFKEYDDVPPF